MDYNSYYYFIELCRDKNITKTASRIYMSQQTLSNHLQRMEEELGVSLFYRKKGLELTAAGEQLLNYARIATREYENMKNQLADIAHQERGTIRFGASSLRLNNCLPEILRPFNEAYPHVELRITDTVSRNLIPHVVQGDLDIAIVILNEEMPVLNVTNLMDDWLYLCVTDSLLYRYYPDTAEELKERSFQAAHLNDFADLPFCLYETRLGDTVRSLFDASRVVPKVFMSSTHIAIGLNACMQGFAACVATQVSLNVTKHQIPKDLNIFPLYHLNAPQSQTLKLIWRRDRYQPAYTQYFTDLLTEYYRAVESVSIKRKA